MTLSPEPNSERQRVKAVLCRDYASVKVNVLAYDAYTHCSLCQDIDLHLLTDWRTSTVNHCTVYKGIRTISLPNVIEKTSCKSYICLANKIRRWIRYDTIRYDKGV